MPMGLSNELFIISIKLFISNCAVWVEKKYVYHPHFFSPYIFFQVVYPLAGFPLSRDCIYRVPRRISVQVFTHYLEIFLDPKIFREIEAGQK